MMGYFTMIKANIRKQRESFIGVMLLIFIITVALSAVLTIQNNSKSYEEEQMDRIGYGELTSWCSSDEGLDDAVAGIEGLDEVDHVAVQELLYTRYKVNGTESDSDGLMIPYTPTDYDYHFYEDGFAGIMEQTVEIKPGEIYVSPAFCSLYDAKLGDPVEISITDTQTKKYTIAGFFEDPFMGSSMMGMKSYLVCDEDYQKLEEQCEKDEAAYLMRRGCMLHIFKEADCDLSPNEFQSTVISNSKLGNYAAFTYTKSVTLGFMLILQNIFAGFLMVFVLVLLVVSIIVIGHSINSSIEQDYVNMGILKAVGYTKDRLRMIQLLQYMIAIIVGILAGLPVSFLVIGVVNKITVTSTGLLIPDALPVGACVLCFAVIAVILLTFVFIKTSKIRKITPIRAIRGGVEDIYFKSRFTVPVYKQGLSFWIAVRQLISGKKQYVSACLVTMLLVFFISLVGRIDAWMGPDGEGLMGSFGAYQYDLGFYSDTISEQEVTDRIEDITGIESRFFSCMQTVTIDGITYTTNVTDDPNRYNILKGRTCKYENEVLITEFVAEDLDVSIGDTVTLSQGEHKEEFVVSGINGCANDMGANCSINLDGLKRLNGNLDSERIFTDIILTDSSKKQEVIDDLNDYYGDKITTDENSWSGLDGIVVAMDAIEKLMYAIVVIFILVVTSLTGSKILYKEKQDMGIYKSLGFATARLRVPFALRFGIVALIGSVLGVVASAVITDPMTTAMLKSCGISSFHSEFNFVQMMLPAVLVIAVFMLFAYFAARKIKKIDPAILIVE